MPRFTVWTVAYDPDKPWVIASETVSFIDAANINDATEQAHAGLPANQRAVIVGRDEPPTAPADTSAT